MGWDGTPLAIRVSGCLKPARKSTAQCSPAQVSLEGPWDYYCKAVCQHQTPPVDSVRCNDTYGSPRGSTEALSTLSFDPVRSDRPSQHSRRSPGGSRTLCREPTRPAPEKSTEHRTQSTAQFDITYSRSDLREAPPVPDSSKPGSEESREHSPASFNLFQHSPVLDPHSHSP